MTTRARKRPTWHTFTNATVAQAADQIAQFCAADNGKYYFKEFFRWADQTPAFTRWLDSLRNMWLESILE